MTDARESRRDHAGPAFARRRFMLGACASTMAASIAASLGLPLGSFAAAAGYMPPAGGGFDAFVALSQHLTGRPSVEPVLGRRIYDALVKADSSFADNVAALNTWLKAHGGVPSDTVTAALEAEDARLSRAVGQIMRAWYLGLVGEAPTVKVLAYEHALMFDPVKDVLTIPSYCRDVPFYWARKPLSG